MSHGTPGHLARRREAAGAPERGQLKRPDFFSLQALPLRPSHQNRGTDLFHTLACAVMSHHALAVLAPPSCICCFGSGC